MDFISPPPSAPHQNFGSSHGELWHFVCTSDLVASSHKENQNSQILMATGILCGLQISELTFCYTALLIYSDRFLSCSIWSHLYETDTYHIAFI